VLECRQHNQGKIAQGKIAGAAGWKIFVTDPNGVMIELNYEMAKEPG
jgi:hypothetical protein